VSWGPRAPPLLERAPTGPAHGSGPREFDHPLREKGVEGGETGLFSTSRPYVVQAVKLISFCRSLYALMLLFPPKLSSHGRRVLGVS
jgi:hypothetical protein